MVSLNKLQVITFFYKLLQFLTENKLLETRRLTIKKIQTTWHHLVYNSEHLIIDHFCSYRIFFEVGNSRFSHSLPPTRVVGD